MEGLTDLMVSNRPGTVCCRTSRYWVPVEPVESIFAILEHFYHCRASGLVSPCRGEKLDVLKSAMAVLVDIEKQGDIDSVTNTTRWHYQPRLNMVEYRQTSINKPKIRTPIFYKAVQKEEKTRFLRIFWYILSNTIGGNNVYLELYLWETDFSRNKCSRNSNPYDTLIYKQQIKICFEG